MRRRSPRPLWGHRRSGTGRARWERPRVRPWANRSKPRLPSPRSPQGHRTITSRRPTLPNVGPTPPSIRTLPPSAMDRPVSLDLARGPTAWRPLTNIFKSARSPCRRRDDRDPHGSSLSSRAVASRQESGEALPACPYPDPIVTAGQRGRTFGPNGHGERCERYPPLSHPPSGYVRSLFGSSPDQLTHRLAPTGSGVGAAPEAEAYEDR